MANLDREQLLRLARLGASARLKQLREEEAAIRAEFPELFARGRGEKGASAASPPAATTRRRRRRRKMSAAARRKASERMKKFWAERRKAEAGK